MKKKIFISRDNIFADLGLRDSDEMRIRSDLMSELVSIIRNKEIATVLSESIISALMSGKINEFNSDTLLNYLNLVLREDASRDPKFILGSAALRAADGFKAQREIEPQESPKGVTG